MFKFRPDLILHASPAQLYVSVLQTYLHVILQKIKVFPPRAVNIKKYIFFYGHAKDNRIS